MVVPKYCSSLKKSAAKASSSVKRSELNIVCLVRIKHSPPHFSHLVFLFGGLGKIVSQYGHTLRFLFSLFPKNPICADYIRLLRYNSYGWLHPIHFFTNLSYKPKIRESLDNTS